MKLPIVDTLACYSSLRCSFSLAIMWSARIQFVIAWRFCKLSIRCRFVVQCCSTPRQHFPSSRRRRRATNISHSSAGNERDGEWEYIELVFFFAHTRRGESALLCIHEISAEEHRREENCTNTRWRWRSESERRWPSPWSSDSQLGQAVDCLCDFKSVFFPLLAVCMLFDDYIFLRFFSSHSLSFIFKCMTTVSNGSSRRRLRAAQVIGGFLHSLVVVFSFLHPLLYLYSACECVLLDLPTIMCIRGGWDRRRSRMKHWENIQNSKN